MIRSDMLVELGSSSKLNAEWTFLSMLRDEGRRAAEAFLTAHGAILAARSTLRHRSPAGRRLMGLAGVLLGLALLVWLAFPRLDRAAAGTSRGAAGRFLAGEPLLAHWTQTFMGSAARSWRSSSRCSDGRAVRQADGGQRIGLRERATG